MEKYPVVTQNNDKILCAKSSKFYGAGGTLEDRGGLKKTLCLCCNVLTGGRTDWHVNNMKDSKCMEGEGSVGQGSLIQPCDAISSP